VIQSEVDELRQREYAMLAMVSRIA